MSSQKGQPSDTGTREKLLLAAMEEFAANGFSGARIDRITKRAGVNVRMIYHFFGNKKGLLDEVLQEIFRERQQIIPKNYENLRELLDVYFQGYAADKYRVRLLQWEALEHGSDEQELSTIEDRRKAVRQRMNALARLQIKGQPAENIDTEMLYLFCVALSIYPMSFPQSVYVATGEDVYSSQFQERYRKALGQLSDLLAGLPVKTD